MKIENQDQVTPSCWNRAPFGQARTLHGIDERTGKPISITLTNDWFKDRCTTWDGVGIGAPTAEYPSGTPYPIAHGWAKACASCRWAPNQSAAAAPTSCWCQTCRPITAADMRMVVCPTCGNKRCPRANSCANTCTGSNDPGQPGSAY